MHVEEQIRKRFGIDAVVCGDWLTYVSDVVPVATPQGRCALKIYSPTRLARDVAWEVELVRHLAEHGAPVSRPLQGGERAVQILSVSGSDRPAVLFEWAAGEKPNPSNRVYRLLGEAAAQIHEAADSFTSPSLREFYDAACLIDRQLGLMKGHLLEAGCWERARALGDRLHRHIASADLSRGICHMDLTLDNVHLDAETMTVFDFDSAGECWRALEPHAVLRASADYFQNWLQGYRSIRVFTTQEERAVRAFSIAGEFRSVAWKLGVAASSREPVLTASDLPAIVDAWSAWEL